MRDQAPVPCKHLGAPTQLIEISRRLYNAPSLNIPLDRLSGLRQLVEEVVHGAQYLGFVGTKDVVIGVGQTDDLC
jgi:hypothetical protein